MRVREAIAVVIAELTVEKRLPLQTALTNAALGNRVHEVFTELGGEASERTIRNDIRELLGPPVGQMPDQFRAAAPDIPIKVRCRGARTFNLQAIPDLRLRHRLLLRIRKLIPLLIRVRSGVSRPLPPSARCLTANRRARRVAGALNRAIGVADGQRNKVGNWLAWRLRRLGLARHEAEEVMERYQQEVAGLARPSYTRSEAMATVRSVFKHGVVLEDDIEPWEPTRETQRKFSFCW